MGNTAIPGEWAMNRMEVPGRRAAEHPQGVRRRRKRQSPGERAAEGGGPYGGLSIEGPSRKKRTSTLYHQMSGSEKRSLSIR